MTNFFLKAVSPQSTSIYSLLAMQGKLNAKQIGKTLKVLPHAVYRAVKPLVEIGVVRKIDEYPISFEAQSFSDAVDIFSQVIRQNFQETFTSNQLFQSNNNHLNISFIHDRQNLLDETTKDVERAENSIDFIVSGLEIPADAILAFKDAAERGVRIRALVQNTEETSKEMFRNWGKIGAKVKYSPNMEARIFIFDQKVVYFTSYDLKSKNTAIGSRFEYIPYAALMNDIFAKRWKYGKNI